MQDERIIRWTPLRRINACTCRRIQPIRTKPVNCFRWKCNECALRNERSRTCYICPRNRRNDRSFHVLPSSHSKSHDDALDSREIFMNLCPYNTWMCPCKCSNSSSLSRAYLNSKCAPFLQERGRLRHNAAIDRKSICTAIKGKARLIETYLRHQAFNICRWNIGRIRHNHIITFSNERRSQISCINRDTICKTEVHSVLVRDIGG